MGGNIAYLQKGMVKDTVVLLMSVSTKREGGWSCPFKRNLS